MNRAATKAPIPVTDKLFQIRRLAESWMLRGSIEDFTGRSVVRRLAYLFNNDELFHYLVNDGVYDLAGNHQDLTVFRTRLDLEICLRPDRMPPESLDRSCPSLRGESAKFYYAFRDYRVHFIEALAQALAAYDVTYRTEPEVTERIGLSGDGRTYFTAGGEVKLTPTAAEIIGIIVEQWKAGCPEVATAFIHERVAVSQNRGDTRLRDRMGRQRYKQLLRPGETKGTVRLIHPPHENPSGG